MLLRINWTGLYESGILRVLTDIQKKVPTLRTLRGPGVSDTRVRLCAGFQEVHSEDSTSVSHRIKKELRRLCQCLLYITAARIRPASRKMLCIDNGAGEASCGTQERPSGYEMKKSALDLIGRVLGSLPIHSEGSNTVSAIETFVCKLREEDADFSSSEADRPMVPVYLSRRTKVSRSPGLENLKVTLNLARGDLEEALLAS